MRWTAGPFGIACQIQRHLDDPRALGLHRAIVRGFVIARPDPQPAKRLAGPLPLLSSQTRLKVCDRCVRSRAPRI